MDDMVISGARGSGENLRAPRWSGFWTQEGVKKKEKKGGGLGPSAYLPYLCRKPIYLFKTKKGGVIRGGGLMCKKTPKDALLTKQKREKGGAT